MRAALPLGLMLALAAVSLTPVADTDAWMHLKAGETIVSTLKIPRVDTYSHTASGNPWVTHEWLFEVVIFAIHSAAGTSGLIAGKFLILAVTFALLYHYGASRRLPAAFGALFLLAIMLLSMGRFTVRPHLFTYLFVVITILILHDYRDFSRDRLLVLPPVFLVWANLHSGVVFGLGILGIFTLVESVAVGKPNVRLLRIAGAAILACLLNPNLHETVLYPVRYLLHPTFKHAVAEHAPIFHPAFRGARFVFWFQLVSAITLAAAVARACFFRRIDFSSVLVCTLFAVATLLGNRNRVLFGITAVPVVAALLLSPRRSSKTLENASNWLRRSIPQFVVLSLLVAFAATTWTHGVALGQGRFRKPAFGVSRDTPTVAADFIKNSGLRGNMLNEYRFGGYFIWALSPEHPVFIDGRNLVYGAGVLEDYRLILQADRRFEELLREHKIEFIVLQNTSLERDPNRRHPIHTQLVLSDAWKLIHFDDTSVIYVRAGSVNDEIVKRFAYEYLEPFGPNHLARGVALAEHRAGIERELERLLTTQPEGIESHVLAAKVLAALGEYAKAIDVYDDLGRRLGENADVRENRTTLLGALVARADSLVGAGQLGEGIVQYREAARLAPQDGRIHFGLGHAYWEDGRVEPSLEHYHLALAIDSTNTDVLNNLGFAYASLGDLESARKYWMRAASLDPSHEAAKNLRKLESLRSTPDR